MLVLNVFFKFFEIQDSFKTEINIDFFFVFQDNDNQQLEQRQSQENRNQNNNGLIQPSLPSRNALTVSQAGPSNLISEDDDYDN